MKVPRPMKPIIAPFAKNVLKDLMPATWRSFTEAERKEIEKQNEDKKMFNPKELLPPEIKEAGIAEYIKLYKAPFKFAMGTIFDASDNMVLQIRGWGHIQYSVAKNVTPEQIQDSFGETMCDLLNDWYKSLTSTP